MNIKETTDKTQKKVLIRTYGCQMNAHDSEKLLATFSELGYTETKEEEDADIIVFNTCCVRESAENKVYGHLGILKKRKETNPDLKIVLCGCMMQNETSVTKIMQTYRHVDVVFGTFNMHKLPELLALNNESGKQVIDVWDKHAEKETEQKAKRSEKYKASVNIMYGCDNFCTYCIVPYVRGRERSREQDDIINEIKELVKDGVLEITLLGQNVNSYGKGLPYKTDFPTLLREINKIENLERIRFITSHPKDLSQDLIKAMAECDKICNHLHLPFQSGSSKVLKKMNRGYTKEHYMGLIEECRKLMPDIAITTDIIVGFPTETEEDFLETCDVVKNVNFSGAFTFIYSIRTGTPAATMEGQIPEDVISDRFSRLLNILNPLVLEENKKRIGKTMKVLVDELSDPEKGIVTGRASDNSIVHLKGTKDLVGTIVTVKIVDCKTFYLVGEIIND